MKNKLIIILVAGLLATFINAAAEPAPVAPVTPPISAANELTAITKERDDAKAALAASQAQQQQNAIVTEYYKAVAEKNEAILRVVAVNEQLQAAQKELAAVKAELEVEKVKVAALQQKEHAK